MQNPANALLKLPPRAAVTIVVPVLNGKIWLTGYLTSRDALHQTVAGPDLYFLYHQVGIGPVFIDALIGTSCDVGYSQTCWSRHRRYRNCYLMKRYVTEICYLPGENGFNGCQLAGDRASVHMSKNVPLFSRALEILNYRLTSQLHCHGLGQI